MSFMQAEQNSSLSNARENGKRYFENNNFGGDWERRINQIRVSCPAARKSQVRLINSNHSSSWICSEYPVVLQHRVAQKMKPKKLRQIWINCQDSQVQSFEIQRSAQRLLMNSVLLDQTWSPSLTKHVRVTSGCMELGPAGRFIRVALAEESAKLESYFWKPQIYDVSQTNMKSHHRDPVFLKLLEMPESLHR